MSCYLAQQAVSLDDVLLPPVYFWKWPHDWSRYHCVRQELRPGRREVPPSPGIGWAASGLGTRRVCL